ncbi:NAD(+)/NADH kinase [Candidatus Woesearchaeota archaeon]|nr:NAD(+)/NADH kinase [Candidatus Woesearchaeota archaeon]
MLDKVVVVKKPTGLEELLKRHTTTSQVKFYLETRGESYDYYKSAHDDYKKGLKKTIASIPKELCVQVIDKENLSTFQFAERDIVVSVGDPGLFVNIAKYVGKQPVISVNPDEQRFENILSTCTPNDFPRILKKALDGDAQTEKLTMAEARLEDGQVLYALNDLFIGRSDHASARYMIKHNGNEERQSSSGVIVSTGTGSTGWLTSIVKGAAIIARGGYASVSFRRDADYLIFAVREPFPSKITGTTIVYDKVTRENPLIITSNMPEKGIIFSDGMQEDYIEFTAGKTVNIVPSEKKVYLVRQAQSL